MSQSNKNLSIMEINQAAPKFQDVSIAPMHTVEHILNATMVKTFGCPRSRNAHIEKKKSKCDYELVSIEFMSQQEAKDIVDLSKLPEDASETLRIVRIGGYDVCACIGLHVENTSEIGTFKIISYDYNEERKVLRMRFKLIK